MKNKYTKAQLEEIVLTQYENLNAMHDLLAIMKLQSSLLHQANKKLKAEIDGFEEKHVRYSLKKVVKK